MLNYGLYQAGWLAMVLGAGRGHPWLGTATALMLLAVHIALARDRRSELQLAVVAGVTGLIVDSSLVTANLIAFPTGNIVSWACPPWIVVMWMQFSTTFRFSLHWLLNRPRLAAGLAAAGGPLAYVVGHRLGAVELQTPMSTPLAVLGLVWSMVIPALLQLARRAEPSGYRWGR